MNDLINLEQSLTMSSREIADLVNSNHSDVKRSAERLATAGVLTQPLAEFEFQHRGNTYTEYLFSKRDSLVLVARLSPEFTAAVVDRWQELERNQSPSIPQTFAEALRLAAEQAERIEQQARELTEAAPKVEFVDRYVAADTGSKGFRQVAKLLKANERELRVFLSERNILYRLGGEWMPYQSHVDAGRFEVKAGVAGEHAFNQAKFTAKGVKWVAGVWAQYQLEDRLGE